MSEKSSELSNKQSEFSVVISLAISPHDEMRTLLRRIAEGESVKQRINTAARRIGLSAARVRELWYGTARRIEAGELDAARRVVAANEAKAREATTPDVLDRIARIEAALSRIDPDFFREEVTALRRAARPMGAGNGEGRL